MKPFMGADYLLGNKTAESLYHEYAADLPIIDYHCHINPMEVAQDKKFANMTQIWLNGDHYKWRLMRAAGEAEENITGKGDDYEKFKAFARAMPKAINNAVYHWTQLELARYFDCTLPLNPDTAEEIWNHCNQKLAGMSARSIMAQSKVKAIATTDDPVDSLEWHKTVKADGGFSVKMLPTFRPDKAINIDKPGFTDYIKQLGDAAGFKIKSINDLYEALKIRMEYFTAHGCCISDHGLDYIPFAHNSGGSAYDARIFEKALNGSNISPADADAYKTTVLLFLGEQYARRNWVMQLHYGVMRNVNVTAFRRVGADAGFDAINGVDCVRNIAAYLNALTERGNLPRTVLYSLNPNDDAALDVIAGCFPRVQHGSAWWFNDTKPGMEAQMISLSSRGLLGGFIGMLTDSRSFLSYTRHEYFRRILCNFIGGWAEAGEYPPDMKALGQLVTDISYNNVVNYFGFEV